MPAATLLPVISPNAMTEAAPDLAELPELTACSVSEDDGTVTSQFLISGMYCAACAGLIERAANSVPGVREATVQAASERLSVRWSPAAASTAQLQAAIARAGYRAVPDHAAPARTLRQQERRQAIWRWFVAGFLMMQIMMLATPRYVAEPGEMSADLYQLLIWGEWVLCLPVVLFSAGPFFKAAWRQLRQRTIGMDVPVTVGIIVTFIASTGAALDPSGPFGHEVYFDSLAMFVAFLLGSRFLEMRARHRVAESLEQASQRLPEQVERRGAEGRFERVAPSQLLAGDTVRVPLGQAFPADGVLLEGETAADESLLTGESRAIGKLPGSELIAGSLNLLAPVLMTVHRTGEQTRYHAIVRLMRSALTQRPALVRMADRIAGPFLWAVLALAALAALGWYFIDPAKALPVAVAVLIVTCPCALSLAAPTALLAAAGNLARRGVLLHRLDALEALAGIDTVVFDKTGTLTEAGLQLQQPEPAPDTPAGQTLLAQAGSLAAHSLHPVSRAVVQAAALPATQDGWREVREFPGLGLEALSVDGSRWRLGRPEWVANAGTGLAAGRARLAFGPVGEVRWRAQISESLRADAPAALAALQADGLRTALLSGDEPARVGAMAATLKLDEAIGGASPEAKLAHLAALQGAGRRVLVVGDGINDAPILAQADVSFAMGQGADLARNHADAVLLSGRLRDIVVAKALAGRTLTIIRQNFAWALLYNLASVPLAVVGLLPPWLAGIGMALSSLVVVLNTLRLGRSPASTE
ncbi:cation-translocating P-type ATPase [Chitinimonas sp. BJYL2]|uniref:heavy metal translocating P-type ATPase n=1 Tax=Chitinimonas sp. BJYL2 TaxID=2976696 RepID=UPI0022B4F81D|nr:cation-translocating P-type ATPase [Chitinimonas sp. BJYL2]